MKMFTGSHTIALKLAIFAVILLNICVQVSALLKPNIVQKPNSKGYATDGGCMYDYNVDYLDLVLSWASGVCSTNKVNCRKDVEAKFTIHGLWPQRKQELSPQNCCTKTFYDSSEVKTMKRELREHWPAIDWQSDETFWPYEWNKHGTCAVRIKGVSTVREYFEFSLKSFKQWDILKILKQFNYVPSNQNYYSGQGMVNDLSRVVGRQVSIDCVPAAKDPRILVLTQVHICFDKNLQLTNCRNTSRKCREKIRFPAKVW